MEHETPKKLVVLAIHGDGEPPKTLDARYVKEIMIEMKKMLNSFSKIFTKIYKDTKIKVMVVRMQSIT